MKVTLIDCTSFDEPRRAAAMLIFAKSTRLEMSPKLYEEIVTWDESDILAELDAIARTIPSAWEFLDYTFLIEGVSRGFTHQFVRGRHASYAQQTMRILKVTGMDDEPFPFVTGPTVREELKRNKKYCETMDIISDRYNELIRMGVSIEDARGILPTNIATNIMVKMNLRTFVETVRKRSSPRVQQEYRNVLMDMVRVAVAQHPFLNVFLQRDTDNLFNELYELANDMPEVRRLRMVKLLDELKPHTS